MATLSANAHSFTADENTIPIQADPFWQSTPRTTPQVRELLMSVKQVVPQAAGNAPKTNWPRSTAARRPQCTHMTMNRLHGEHTCHSCGKVPNIGWVYVCQQDRLLKHHHMVPDSVEALPVVADSGSYFEAQAKVAESIGMSSTVVKQMRAGQYSFDQIETLLQQRRHVLEVIKKAESRPVQGTPPTKGGGPLRSHPPADSIIASVGATTAPAVQRVGAASLPMTPAGTPANTPTESTTTTPTKRTKSNKRLTCQFQVCHACRPFFVDRLPTSFETVLNGEIPAPTTDEVAKLPVQDARIVRNLLQRQLPQLAVLDGQDQDGTNTGMVQVDAHGDDTSEDWTPTSTTNSEAESQLLLEGEEQYPCTGSGICPVWSYSEGCAYDNGFDDGKRAMQHGFVTHEESDYRTPGRSYARLRPTQERLSGTPGGTSSTGSSISLPEPKTEPLTPVTPTEPSFGLDLESRFGKTGKAATVCGIMSNNRKHHYGLGRSCTPGKDSSSSLGSEVEVEGGVALTEEAVETGVPDIVTTN